MGKHGVKWDKSIQESAMKVDHSLMTGQTYLRLGKCRRCRRAVSEYPMFQLVAHRANHIVNATLFTSVYKMKHALRANWKVDGFFPVPDILQAKNMFCTKPTGNGSGHDLARDVI